ncbi:MAG: Stp1/IreP family PP2C-type Ser/Thr phosphatase [Polyangiaceae bacterium]|nr:Stp1/IreP family PP2C-type Ser/Thr phosphatase [Polyangiaceae bacterium]
MSGDSRKRRSSPHADAPAPGAHPPEASAAPDPPKSPAAADATTSAAAAPAPEAQSPAPAAGEAEASADPAAAAPVGEGEEGEGRGAAQTTEAVEPSSSPRPKRPQIRLRLFGRTDVGQIREHNEDNFLIADLTRRTRGVVDPQRPMEVGPNGLLMAVCDGMGGAAAGEIASQLAVDIVFERMAANDRDGRDGLAGDIVRALEVAGLRILQESNDNRACRGMGTTATVAALLDDHLLIGQVGDSRAYLMRGERLVQVTRDQSLVNQLIEAGQLTEEEAENFEHSNIILQALGTADAVQVDLTYAELRDGDVLIMCSDGLSGMIRDDEIRHIVRRHAADPVEVCGALIDAANQAGGHDNITVIAGVFEGEGLEPPTAADVAALRYAKYAGLEAASGAGAGASDGAGPGGAGAEEDPRIEVHGEIEVAPDSSWLTGDEPADIPTEGVPSVSTLLLVGVAVVCLVIVFLVLL